MTIYYDTSARIIESISVALTDNQSATSSKPETFQATSPLADIRDLSPEAQANALISLAPQLASQSDTNSLREALTIAQSINNETLQVKALIAIVKALAEVRHTESLQRVVEIVVTMSDPSQSQLVQAISQAYQMLGETQKALDVPLISSVLKLTLFCNTLIQH